MTRLELRIDEIVLHGCPQEMADGIGPLVESRLAELAHAGRHEDHDEGHNRVGDRIGDQAGLASLVAGRIWAQASVARGAKGEPS